MIGQFKLWCEGDSNPEMELISFSGTMLPLIKQRVSTEMVKRKKDISKELAQSLLQSFKGKQRENHESQTIWSFPINNSPLTFKGIRLVLGNIVLAYRFPGKEDNPIRILPPKMSPEDEDKFLKSKERDMLDFLDKVVFHEEELDQILQNLVKELYDTYVSKKSQSEEQASSPTILWEHKLTSNNGSRKIGSVILVYKPN